MVYDLTGQVAPTTSSFIVDLHDIRKLKSDDAIPNQYRSHWVSNLKLMAELKNIKLNRSAVPEYAKILTINTIDTADASKTSLVQQYMLDLNVDWHGTHASQSLLVNSYYLTVHQSSERNLSQQF